MRLSRLKPLGLGLALGLLMPLAIVGCGGKASPTQPAPLKEVDDLSAALPKGVTLETPVVPNIMYGESSKTVKDALASVQAVVRDNAIHDGGMGREIRFHTAGDKKGKTEKKSAKAKTPFLVIELAP